MVRASPRKTIPYTATGSGAIALSTTVGKRFRFISAHVAFNLLPTTSEDVVLTVNSKHGAAYDIDIRRGDPSGGAGTGDVAFYPEEDEVYEAGDELELAYTNTDGRTYGARILVELA